MAKIIHPRYIRKGMNIFTGEGTPITITDIFIENGVYKITAVMQRLGKSSFLDWEWDMHQYDDDPNPPPALYRTNPLGK